MNVGMLWFDNDTKSELDQKIERAALYYRKKYGKVPNLCFVHPSMLPSEESLKHGNGNHNHNSSGEKKNGKDNVTKDSRNSTGVEIRVTRSILPNHFWIGINGNPSNPTDS